MSAYTPPTEFLPVYNSSVFLKSASAYISQSYADTHYIQYTSTQSGVVNFNAILSLNSGIINNFNNTNSVLGYNSSGALGFYNTAVGYEAMKSATSASNYNTAYGYESLNATTTGGNNSALGANTGLTNTTGTNNSFLGYGADADGNNYSYSTAVGSGSKITKSNQIILGSSNQTVTIPNQIEFSYSTVPTLTNASIGYFINSTNIQTAQFAVSTAVTQIKRIIIPSAGNWLLFANQLFFNGTGTSTSELWLTITTTGDLMVSKQICSTTTPTVNLNLTYYLSTNASVTVYTTCKITSGTATGNVASTLSAFSAVRIS